MVCRSRLHQGTLYQTEQRTLHAGPAFHPGSRGLDICEREPKESTAITRFQPTRLQPGKSKVRVTRITRVTRVRRVRLRSLLRHPRPTVRINMPCCCLASHVYCTWDERAGEQSGLASSTYKLPPSLEDCTVLNIDERGGSVDWDGIRSRQSRAVFSRTWCKFNGWTRA